MGLIEGLVALGYRENEDFVIGVRFTRGDSAVLPAVARELVRDGVDILFCFGESAAKAAQQATTTHPIVFEAVGDPVGQGFIQSYARPGGNITGVTDLNIEVSAKRLELFTGVAPGTASGCCSRTMHTNAHQAANLMQYRAAAHRLGIDAGGAVSSAPWRRRGMPWPVSGRRTSMGCWHRMSVDLNIPGFVLEATTRQGIPSMFYTAFYLKDGGLASYGPSAFASGRQAARLVDKIIKGAHPRDIPVEVDNYFEFVINLKVAKALGLTIPPVVLYQADRIIR